MSHAFLSLDDDLNQLHGTEHAFARITREQDARPAAARTAIVEQCQAIAEGIRTDRHRTTWTYNRAIAAQRAAVLAHREEVMEGSVSADRVRDLIAEHLRYLVAARGSTTVFDTARFVRRIGTFVREKILNLE